MKGARGKWRLGVRPQRWTSRQQNDGLSRGQAWCLVNRNNKPHVRSVIYVRALSYAQLHCKRLKDNHRSAATTFPHIGRSLLEICFDTGMCSCSQLADGDRKFRIYIEYLVFRSLSGAGFRRRLR